MVASAKKGERKKVKGLKIEVKGTRVTDLKESTWRASDHPEIHTHSSPRLFWKPEYS
jgi:hypothetical protein